MAVAGDAAAAAAALAVGAPYGVVQLAVPRPGTASGDAAAAAGSDGSPRLGFGAAFGTDRCTRSFGAGGGGGADADGPRGRLARAFALNPDGVVLVSMLSAERRAADAGGGGAAAAAPGLARLPRRRPAAGWRAGRRR